MLNGISVIITSDRPNSRLKNLLEKLGQQTLPTEHYEVIVSLNTEPTKLLLSLKLPYPLQFIKAFDERAAGCNTAAQLGQYSILLFLSDELLPGPQLLHDHLKAHEENPGGVVLGYFSADYPQNEGRFLSKLMNLQYTKNLNDQGQIAHRFGYRDLISPDFSISKSIFEDLEGFDAGFATSKGGELDFGIRLVKRNIAFRAIQIQACWQPQPPNRWELDLNTARTTGRGEVLILQRHPFMSADFEFGSPPQGRLRGRLWGWLWKKPFQAMVLSFLLRLIYQFFEKLKFRSLEQRVFDVLREYYYWLGVHDVLRKKLAWQRMQEALSAYQDETYRELKIELLTDLPQLDQLLKQTKFDSLRLLYDGQEIGYLPPRPAVEALRPVHVREFIVTHLDFQLVMRLARNYADLYRQLPLPPPNFTGTGEDGYPPLHLSEPTVFWSLPSVEGCILKTYITEYKVGQGFPTVSNLNGYGQAWVLIRLGLQPLGVVQVDLPPFKAVLTLSALEAAIKFQMGVLPPLPAVPNSASPSPSHTPLRPPISIIICTHNRANMLKNCLGSLARLDYPDYEVIVVDSAPKDESTRKLIETTSYRYLREKRPGPNLARNFGAAQARYDIFAFIDDDVRVDRDWLHRIADGFTYREVAAVSGLILPFELETPAQHLFEQFGGMCRGFVARHYQLDYLSAFERIKTFNLGTTANMAIKRAAFEQIQGFDQYLSVGEDLELFYRLLKNGFLLRYDPAALVWHQHRRTFKELERQLYGYGKGFGNYLKTISHKYPEDRTMILQYTLRQWLLNGLIWRLYSGLRGKTDYPLRLSWSELYGAFNSIFTSYPGSR